MVADSVAGRTPPQDPPTAPVDQPPGAPARSGLASAGGVLEWLDRPLRRLGPERPDAPARSDPRLAAPAPRTGTAGVATVLIAEHDDEVRVLLERLLAADGWQVQSAVDGAGALRDARRRPPDLLLVDADLAAPGGSGAAHSGAAGDNASTGGGGGLQLVRALRADARTSDLPVVALSAARPGAAADALAAGADDHLARPFDPLELVARLLARLDSARSRSGERARRDETEANLRIALAARERVGIAIGLVMAQRRCTPDQAFAVLKDASQHNNVKLAEIAQRVIAAGNPVHDRTV